MNTVFSDRGIAGDHMDGRVLPGTKILTIFISIFTSKSYVPCDPDVCSRRPALAFSRLFFGLCFLSLVITNDRGFETFDCNKKGITWRLQNIDLFVIILKYLFYLFISSLRRVISSIYATAIIRPEVLACWCPDKVGGGGGRVFIVIIYQI